MDDEREANEFELTVKHRSIIVQVVLGGEVWRRCFEVPDVNGEGPTVDHPWQQRTQHGAWVAVIEPATIPEGLEDRLWHALFDGQGPAYQLYDRFCN